MSIESTNVENIITVVGGEVVSNLENKTIIPPTKSVEKDSPEKEDVLTIALEGKWIQEKSNKEAEISDR